MKYLRHIVFISILLMPLGLSARASVLLIVDVSDPSNVSITSTNADASQDSSSTSNFDGVDLVGFLTFAAVEEPTMEGNLTPAGATLPYDTWETDSYSGTDVDINLYYGDEDTAVTQTFTTDSAAFTGVATGLDFSSFIGEFQPDGTTGYILAGYGGNDGGVIGEWVVVPEPSQYGFLITLGLAGLFGIRRLANRGTFRFAPATFR